MLELIGVLYVKSYGIMEHVPQAWILGSHVIPPRLPGCAFSTAQCPMWYPGHHVTSPPMLLPKNLCSPLLPVGTSAGRVGIRCMGSWVLGWSVVAAVPVHGWKYDATFTAINKLCAPVQKQRGTQKLS